MHNKSLTAITKYKLYKNKLTKIIKKAERKHFENKFNKACGNIKETWKIIKSITSPNSGTTSKINELNINNTLVSD